MQYILSEEEYKTLQSLESTNKELRCKLVGTERELHVLKVANHAFKSLLEAKDREIAKLTQKFCDADYEAASKAFLQTIKAGLL